MQGVLDLARRHTLEQGSYLSTETRHLEFKIGGGKGLIRMFPYFVKKYGCAFLNTEGGTILFGVQDDGEVVGRPINKYTENKLHNIVNRTVKFEFDPPLSPEKYTLRFLKVTCPAGTPQIPDLKVISLHFNAPEPVSTTIYQVDGCEVYLRRDASIWGPLNEWEIEEFKKLKHALSVNHVNQQRRDVVEVPTDRRLKTKPGFVRFKITGLGETPKQDKSNEPQSTSKRSDFPQRDCPLQKDAISAIHMNQQQRDVVEVPTAGGVKTKTGFVRITITGPGVAPEHDKSKDPQNTVKRSRSPVRDSPLQRMMDCQDINNRQSLHFNEQIEDTETLKSVSFDPNDPQRSICNNIAIHRSYLSRHGGTLLFGVMNGRVHGLKVNRKLEDDIRLRVDGTMNRFQPPIFPQSYTLKFLAVGEQTENNLKVVCLNFRVPPFPRRSFTRT